MTSCFPARLFNEGGADTVAKTVSKKTFLTPNAKRLRRKAAHEAEQKARDEARQRLPLKKASGRLNARPGTRPGQKLRLRKG